MFQSEDFKDVKGVANTSGMPIDLNNIDARGSHNMQIVDEADETDSQMINRPSFFDAIQMKVEVKSRPANEKFNTVDNSTKKTSPQ